MVALLLGGGASPMMRDHKDRLPEECVDDDALDPRNARALVEQLQVARATAARMELTRAADASDLAGVHAAVAGCRAQEQRVDALHAAATSGHVLAVRELLKRAAAG